MNTFAHVAMIAWIPLTLALFATMPARRAIVVSMVGGWLFLPNARYDLPALPDFTKTTAITWGTLLGALLFSSQEFRRVRFRAVDIPMVVLCLSPAVTSILNGLGIYDGLSSVAQQLSLWGFAYVLGRVFFRDADSVRLLALGILIGGLLYVPLCLYEIRMSPQLHLDVYGFRTKAFAHSYRYGGYRPQVFMWTYLPLVLWLCVSATICYQFWVTRAYQRVLSVPIAICLAALLGTIVLCKTFVAGILLPIGVGCLFAARRLKTTLPITIILLMVPVILTVRATGAWSAHSMIDMVARISEDRAQSLGFRLEHEDALAAKAMQRPFFGWGGFRRSRIVNEEGRDLSVTDGLWIIQFGENGLVGLAALTALFFIPLWRFRRVASISEWSDPRAAAACALAVCVLGVFVYNIPNSSSNPIMVAAIGGLNVMGTSGARRPPG